MDMTKTQLRQAMKEAYDRGYSQGYSEGLKDGEGGTLEEKQEETENPFRLRESINPGFPKHLNWWGD